jgi:uncharacterized protein with PQ loop repeat
MVTFYSLTILMGWLAVLAGLFGTYAQFHRAITLGMEGVSPATWVFFVYMGSFWIAYGLVAHSWQLVTVSLIMLPFQLAILFRLRIWKQWRVASEALVFFLLCSALPSVLWGWVGGVYGMGVAMTIIRGPQLIELIRHEGASGVSVGSWAFGVLGSALWFVYYSGAHLWAAQASTTCVGLANLAIAVFAGWRHQEARRKLIAREVFVSRRS